MDNGKCVRYPPEQIEAFERLYHECPKPISKSLVIVLSQYHLNHYPWRLKDDEGCAKVTAIPQFQSFTIFRVILVKFLVYYYYFSI